VKLFRTPRTASSWVRGVTSRTTTCSCDAGNIDQMG
jgi:hypothetical protein